MGVTAERIGLVDKEASGAKESERRPVVLVGRDRELFIRSSQDIADSSDRSQMLTILGMEGPLCGCTAMDSGADRVESASLMLTISTRPRSTSWK